VIQIAGLTLMESVDNRMIFKNGQSRIYDLHRLKMRTAYIFLFVAALLSGFIGKGSKDDPNVLFLAQSR